MSPHESNMRACILNLGVLPPWMYLRAGACVCVCVCSQRQGRFILGAVSFAAVLCLKHTFIYAAPVYAVVLLRRLSIPRFLLACGLSAGGVYVSV